MSYPLRGEETHSNLYLYFLSPSAGGHRHVNKTSNVLLTNANHLALGGLNISLPPRLSQIHEEMAMEPNESSVAAEFTTHVPTAGELSSTVTIPCQARDHNDSSTVELEVRGAGREGGGGAMHVAAELLSTCCTCPAAT